MALGFKAANALGLVPADGTYDTLWSKLILRCESQNAMLEVQDELACLQQGDWTLCHLATR